MSDTARRHFLRERAPQRWPDDVIYSNAITAIEGLNRVAYYLPKVHKHVELFVLPPDHVAYGKGANLGKWRLRKYLKTLSGGFLGLRATAALEVGDVVGYYAGDIGLGNASPFNAYTMSGDDTSGVVYDAGTLGNETRFINAPDNIPGAVANVAFGQVKHIGEAPEWVTAYPIVVTLPIEEGDELLLDYGPDYWEFVRNASSAPLYLARPKLNPGMRMDLDMNRVLASSSLPCKLYRGDYEHSHEIVTIERVLPQGQAEVLLHESAGMGMRIVVEVKALKMARGAMSLHAFSVGDPIDIWEREQNRWLAGIIVECLGRDEYAARPLASQGKKAAPLRRVNQMEIRPSADDDDLDDDVDAQETKQSKRTRKPNERTENPKRNKTDESTNESTNGAKSKSKRSTTKSKGNTTKRNIGQSGAKSNGFRHPRTSVLRVMFNFMGMKRWQAALSLYNNRKHNGFVEVVEILEREMMMPGVGKAEHFVGTFLRNNVRHTHLKVLPNDEAVVEIFKAKKAPAEFYSFARRMSK